MKIKLMIALVVLALVFGAVLIACDDGELQKIAPGDKEAILDTDYIPYLNKEGKPQNTTTVDTTANKPLTIDDLENAFSSASN